MATNPFLQQSQDGAVLGQTYRLAAGQRVFGNRFVLERYLGQGGMGQVWLAQDTTMDQPRALKFVLPSLIADSMARKRLRNEARLGTELAHPRIVRVFDYVEESNGAPLAAVVMEFVEGSVLSDLLAEKDSGFFEPAEISGWVRDVTEGLKYAHEEKQRYHLDLKPGNIIIEAATGRAKLLDFGLSRSAKDSITRLSGAVSSGTLPYMSPQQIRGKAPSAADDVYGLGATIYELLTGTPPFFRGKLDEQICEDIPEPMLDRRRQNAKEGLNAAVGAMIDAAWENLVARYLHKDAEQRGLLGGPPAIQVPAIPLPTPVPAPPPLKSARPVVPDQRPLLHTTPASPINPPRPASLRTFQDPPAPLGRRYLATLVDGFFLVCVGFIGALVAAVPLQLVGLGGSSVAGVLMVGFYATGLILLAKQTVKSGASLGKQLLGLRVVTETGAPLSFGAAFARTVACWWGLAFVLPIFTVLFHPERRALHDLMVGTKVV